MDFKIIKDDITNVKADAIVLPANEKLRKGSGTSKQIFEKAGEKELEEACKKIKNTYDVRVGAAYPTKAFNLDADYIIHAVVPKWKDGKHKEYELLNSAYIYTLNVCDLMGCSTLAFPLLCSGNNKFDINLAFAIAEESIKSFEPKNNLQTVFLVVYDVHSQAVAEKHGYNVPPYISEKDVLNNDERHVTKTEEMLQQGLEMVKDYISDPKNLIELYKKVESVVNMLKKKPC